MEQFEEIGDSVCVGQRNAAGEERVVLFVKLHPEITFTPEFVRRIAVAIRAQLSARHVPSVILPIAEIPVSISWKVFVFCFLTLELVGYRLFIVSLRWIKMFVQ